MEAPMTFADRSASSDMRPSDGGGRAIGAGLTMGIAIYTGMFAMAGMWRGEEVAHAIDTGAAPLIVHDAVQSFQTAFGEPPANVQLSASASGAFGVTYRASAPTARVPVRAGFEVASARTGSAQGGLPYRGGMASGLATSGAAAVGLVSTGGFVAVNGNDAF
jgi:hypothetical protein